MKNTPFSWLRSGQTQNTRDHPDMDDFKWLEQKSSWIKICAVKEMWNTANKTTTKHASACYGENIYLSMAEERGQEVGGWQRKRGIGRRLSVQQREVAKEKENT